MFRRRSLRRITRLTPYFELIQCLVVQHTLFILDNLGRGETAEAIARDYDVTVADVGAALQYAGELAR